MRKILFVLLITIFTFGLLITDAEAKRFGGGRSFGMNRNVSNFSQSSYRSAPSAIPAAAKPANNGSRWLGPLAGLAIGGLLGSLFMGHGLGTGILSWLAIAAVIFLVLRLFSRPSQQPAREPFMQQRTFDAEPIQAFNAAPNAFSAAQQRPLGFNDEEFLRNAKSLYIRLQTAYDSKNLTDLREFTSPEVFAEIQLQLHERGNEPNQTDVISLEAQLLDVSIQGNSTVASALFSGVIREEKDAQPGTIKEIWHFKQTGMGDRWVVAGIQQV